MKELKDRFRTWLNGDDYQPFTVDGNNDRNLLVRIPCRDNFDYLFGEYLGADQTVQRGSKLYYCGIYHKGEHKMLTRDPGKHYSTWNIFARDRAQYESLFGRYQDFTPEEITQITYNGKTIYEAEPFEQEEDECFEQSM